MTLNNLHFAWYDRLFTWVTQQRAKKEDTDLEQIHIHLVTCLSIAPFFWAYVILGYLTINSHWINVIGIGCGLIFCLSPLLYRCTNKISLLATITILSGFAEVISFSYFTGGIESVALVWLALPPFIAGIIIGPRSALGWAIVCVLTVLTFLTLEMAGYNCPILVSNSGYRWTKILTFFSWIVLNTLLFFILVSYRDRIYSILEDQRQKIDDLFRVLFHDLANPLGRVDIGLHMARKQENPPGTVRGIEIALQATRAMMDITQSVRRMYAVSQGKAHVDLQYVSLRESVSYVKNMFAEDINRKDLKLIFETPAEEELEVLVEPISFKNQVLANIVSNAIKFSPPGKTITITMKSLDLEEAEIEIRDQGIGIPAALLDDLFKINKKTSRDGTMGERGTGFGMHIMKTYVEMFGGKVLVESVENDGTTIKLILKSRPK
jgi:signal transduction histidine kinase